MDVVLSAAALQGETEGPSGPVCLSYCPDTERGCSSGIVHGVFGMETTVSPVQAAPSVN